MAIAATTGSELRRGWHALGAAALGYGTGIGLLVFVNGMLLPALQAAFG